jgi:hypothetical protein
MALQKTEFVGERGLYLAGTHQPSFSTCSIVHDGSCGFHPHVQATQHAWTCIISSSTGDLFLLEEVWMQPSNCICSCLTAVKHCRNACLLKESIQPAKASGGISTCRFCFWVTKRTSQQQICPTIQLFKCFPIQTWQEGPNRQSITLFGRYLLHHSSSTSGAWDQFTLVQKSRWCDLHQVKLRPETDQQLQGG